MWTLTSAWRTNQHVAHAGIAFVISLWVSIHKYYKRLVYFQSCEVHVWKVTWSLQVRRLIFFLLLLSHWLLCSIAANTRTHTQAVARGWRSWSDVIWRFVGFGWALARPLFYSHFHGSVYRCGFSLISYFTLFWEQWICRWSEYMTLYIEKREPHKESNLILIRFGRVSRSDAIPPELSSSHVVHSSSYSKKRPTITTRIAKDRRNVKNWRKMYGKERRMKKKKLKDELYLFFGSSASFLNFSTLILHRPRNGVR